MKSRVPNLVQVAQRIRYLRRAMSTRDAARLALNEHKDVEITVALTSLNRNVAIRGGTSDIDCFNKVLLAEEYRFALSSPPRIIVDGGANVGYATLYYSGQYPAATIVAIEPAPENVEVFRRNCADMPNVTLLQAALWPSEGTLQLANHLDEAWAYSVQEKPPVDGIAVPTVTIPQILRLLNTDRIDLLKLDIEGAERELFSTGSEDWIHKIGHLAIELHDRYRPGCSKAFYAALGTTSYSQELSGENVLITFRPDGTRGGSATRRRGP